MIFRDFFFSGVKQLSFSKLRQFTVLLSFLLFSVSLFAQTKQPPFLEKTNEHWVDSVFNSLTPDQRIAQLFMVAAYSNRDSTHIKELQKLIFEYNIGGLIFF